MNKKVNLNHTQKIIAKICGVLTIILFAYAGLIYFFPTKQLGVNQITSSNIKYGPTELRGTLQKDTAPGVEGNYFIVLEDNKLVLLDIQNIDNLIGKNVTISGVLSPAKVTGQPMTMSISNIKTN